MLRVCHLTTSFLLPHGPSAGILAQIENQDPARIKSTIWSLYEPPVHRDASAVLAPLGIGYRCLGMSRSFADVRVLPRLVTLLRRERPDILHCHLVRANLYGRIAARIVGVPVVVNMLRNVDPYVTGSGLGAAAVRWFERATASWVARYVAVSERVRRDVLAGLRLPDEKIVTVLNAVDLAPFRELPPKTAHEGVVIGTAGGLEPRKNHATLVRAMAMLPEARLVIAGEGEERGNIETLIQALGLEGRVTLAGLVRDIPRFLASVDVFVMASSAEGLPRAIMEAMAAGLPVVATDAGGTREAVEDGVTGMVVPVDDFDRLVDALRTMVGHAEFRHAMGEAGRRRALALFAPERLGNEYTALYERLMLERR